LKNGHRHELKQITIDADNVIVSKTCAFDTLVQMFCVVYCDDDACKKFLQGDDSDVCKLVRQIVHKGVNVTAYKLRAQILRLVFDSEMSPFRMRKIDATCSMSFMVNNVWYFPTSLENSVCSSDVCPKNKHTHILYSDSSTEQL